MTRWRVTMDGTTVEAVGWIGGTLVHIDAVMLVHHDRVWGPNLVRYLPMDLLTAIEAQVRGMEGIDHG